VASWANKSIHAAILVGVCSNKEEGKKLLLLRKCEQIQKYKHYHMHGFVGGVLCTAASWQNWVPTGAAICVKEVGRHLATLATFWTVAFSRFCATLKIKIRQERKKAQLNSD
jgi:hypothetical protein